MSAMLCGGGRLLGLVLRTWDLLIIAILRAFGSMWPLPLDMRCIM